MVGISVPPSSPRSPTWTPGNFATNIEGGARFGYELLWVLLWSNAMAILVQYLAAKLGIATGHTLPENCRAEFSRPVTVGLWVAAEVAAMATDLAEFLGAALGFYLLFGIPMLPAAIVTGVLRDADSGGRADGISMA